MPLSNQEIFNKVVTHLRAQGRKAVSYFDSRCKYRAPDGAKCAVGCLIADEHYRNEYDYGTASYNHVRTMLVASGIDVALDNVSGSAAQSQTMELLRALQFVHDLKDVGKWESEFRGVASTFNLTVPAREVRA